MKNLIGHEVSTRNLKIFFPISMGIHLLVSIALMQAPDIKTEKLPNINLEVSLLPVIAKEKPPTNLKIELKEQGNRSSCSENREEPLPQKRLEPEPHLSMQAEEPKPLPKQKEVEKSETPPALTSTAILLPAQSNLSSEKVENPFSLKASSNAFPFYPDIDSKDLDETPQAEEPKPLPKQKEAEKSETPPALTSTAILLPAQSNLSSEKMENPFSLKASSNAFSSYSDFDSKDLDKIPLPNISPQEGSGSLSKRFPLSDGDITFTPLESPAINSGGNINKTSRRVESTTMPRPKAGGKAPSILTRFIQPKYAENPKPLYPREARKKGYQGEVMLKVEVLANGQVGRVEVKKSSGYELLDRSASTAVKQWKFTPAKKGKETIPFWVNIPIKFQIK
jgi:TonB family protein